MKASTTHMDRASRKFNAACLSAAPVMRQFAKQQPQTYRVLTCLPKGAGNTVSIMFANAD